MAQPKWEPSKKFAGVRWYQHASRKYGIRRDRCFGIRYAVAGKRFESILGWESGGWTEEKAHLKRLELMGNAKQGAGPATPKAENEARRAASAREEAKRISLERFFQETYLPFAQRAKKKSSWTKEEGHFRLYIGPLLGQVPVAELGMDHWDLLVKTLDEKVLTLRSREYITGTLRRILKAALTRKITTAAPPSGKTVGIKAPGDSNRRTREIKPAETAAILAELARRDPHAERFIRFLFLTGCRVSEAAKLTWAFVDLEGKAIHLTKTKNALPRSLPIGGPLEALLRAAGPSGPEDHVFPKPDGTPYVQAPSAFQHSVDHVLNLNAGRGERDRITAHSIRHTVATELAKRLNIRDLMDVMGWKVVAMAARYIKGSEEAQRSALASLEGRLAERASKVVPFQRAKSE